MVRNLKKVLVYFLCSILVVQLLFTGGSEKSSASHSWDARLGLKIVTKPIYARDDSRPWPFNAKTGRNHAVLGMRQSNRNTYEICYCVDYGLGAWTNDYLTSNYTNMTSEQRILLNYTMLYGFNAGSINLQNLSNDQVNRYFATQSLVWIIKEGYFYKDAERAKIENFFAKLYPDSKTQYQSLYNNVKYMAAAPSFATGTKTTLNVNTMKWNSSAKRYELVLTNTVKDSSHSALSTFTVDKSTLPSGVTVSISGEKLYIYSTKDINSMATIRFTKNINKKGKLIAWTNAASTRQSQITLDYDEKPYEKEAFINICTEKKAGLRIVKKSNDNVISGITYNVTSNAYNGTRTYTTGSDGKISLDKIDAGTYTITEVQNNLANYLQIPAQKVTVNRGETKTVTFNNIRKRIRVDISKSFEGEKGNAVVDGSEYGVYKDGKLLEKVTISGGKAVTGYSFYDVNSLYTVKELKAAPGCELDTKVYNVDTTSVAKSTKEYNTVYLKFSNKAITNDVKIVKSLEKNYWDKENLPGKDIEFKLTLNSNKDKTYTAKTDANGNVTFSKIPYGVYTVEEVNVPEGYVKMDNFEVNITSATAGAYTYSKVNNLIKGSVDITKTLEKSEYEAKMGVATKYAQNVKFVANPIRNGNVDTSVALYSEGTDDKGKTVINGLTYGEWQISEVTETVPQGYVAIEPVKVNIKTNGQVEKLELEDKLIRSDVNIVKTLEKTDLDKNVDVKYGEGIKFEARPIIDGNIVEDVVITSEATNNMGQTSFKGLTYGDWQIKEVESTVPEGYLSVEPYTVAITNNSEVIPVTFLDISMKGTVYITKLDKVNNLPVSGCEIAVYNANGDIVFQGKTDQDGRVATELFYGKYTYKEVKAPEGYVLDETIHEFAITENNQVLEENIINDRIRGSLSIIKVNAKDKNITIPNTEFALYTNDGKLIDKYVTDKNGQLTMGPLEYGKYYFVETKAAEGYKLDSTKHYFEIKNNGEVITEYVANEMISLSAKQDKPDVQSEYVLVEDDETPKTGDTSKLNLAIKLACASGMTMALVVITEVVNRRRRRY